MSKIANIFSVADDPFHFDTGPDPDYLFFLWLNIMLKLDESFGD